MHDEHQVVILEPNSREMIILNDGQGSKKKNFKKFFYICALVLFLAGGIMYVKNIFTDAREEIVATKKQKEAEQAGAIFLPNGYEIHPVKVEIHRVYAKNGLMVADKLTDGEKLVVQFENDRELFFTLEQYDNNPWRLVNKGDVCSQVKKFDKDKVLVSEEYLPVAPEFVCYDTKADKVYYN